MTESFPGASESFLAGPVSAIIDSVYRLRPRPGRLTLPDTRCDLLWLDGVAFLAGPQRRAVSSSPVEGLGMRLQPWIARYAFRMPVTELMDQVVPVAWIDRTLDAKLSRSWSKHTIDRAAAHLAVSTAERRRLQEITRLLDLRTTIAQVAGHVGLSERQLERIVEDATGFTPKRFARLRRFRCALREAARGVSLAHAAAAAGYVDQAHLAKDARDFCGVPPAQVLRRVGSVQDSPSLAT